jgi:CRP/FNR family transcriptional regulator, cyclic AMP receptor protein
VSLSTIALFSGLDETEIAAVSALAVTRSFAKNTLIICEGDTSDSLYVVLRGKVKVFLSDEEGKEVTLNTQLEGEYFGELAILDEAPRSASVVTMEETKLAVLSKSAFEQCMVQHPSIALTVMRGMARRLRDLTENVRSLALMDVYGRVARLLLEMSEDAGEHKVIRQRLTQRDIASMVGASREMVSRILRDLTVGGYISIENKIITIKERLPSAW